jgi:hypothetical protein
MIIEANSINLVVFVAKKNENIPPNITIAIIIPSNPKTSNVIPFLFI